MGRVNIEPILARLDKVRETASGWAACCPAHDDKDPSLSIKDAGDRILLYCHAGCPVNEITAAMGISIGALFAEDFQPDDPMPVSPAAALECLQHEMTVLMMIIADIDEGKPVDRERLLKVADEITAIAEMTAKRRARRKIWYQ